MAFNKYSFGKLFGVILLVYFAMSNLRSDFSDSTDPILKLNYASAIEGIPSVINSGIEASSYQWYKDGELLQWETNKSIKIPFPLNGDEGNYFVSTPHKGINFKVAFSRNIKIYINNVEVESDRLEIDSPFSLKLVPFIENLPIRYTLDGSEPTELSEIYESAIEITNSIVLRAKIIIPETDSINVKIK